MDIALFTPALAVALDLALGDPHAWPHPVRLIGAALDRLEALARPWPPALKRAFGALVLFLMATGTYTVVYLACALPVAGDVLGLYFAFAGLALGQLLREARAAAGLIAAGDLPGARLAVSRLVSRDTSRLDAPGLWRTLAETVSENVNDAFVAPLFFLCLGGPPLLWLYKAVSTMDSMWGYRTDRHGDIGWACARTDDFLAWLPARLTAYALVGVGACMGLPARQALREFPAQARTMASPNAGWPMAACAWLCGAAMGGRVVYFGKTVDKPRLGPAGMAWDADRVRTLERLALFSGLAVTGMGETLIFVFRLLFS